MYVLLCGYPPFYGDTDDQVLKMVKKGEFKFSSKDWSGVSEDAKLLIQNLLHIDRATRATAEQALNNVWIKEKAPKASNTPLQHGLVDNLRGFRSANRLKKAALHVIAKQLSEHKIKALRETFQQLDTNADGQLTLAEMKSGLTQAGLSDIPPDLKQIMEEVDADGSGCIDYTEFLAACIDKRTYVQDDVCWSAFRVFDRNGDGKISREELREVLGNAEGVVSAEQAQEILNEVDANGDGQIDFDEFMVMMRKGGGGPSGE